MNSSLLPKQIVCSIGLGLLAVPGFAQLTITQQLPASNAIRVPASSSVRLTASQQLDSSSRQAVKVHSSLRGSLQGGSRGRVVVSGNELIYSPAAPWLPGEVVHVSVTRALRDSSDQTLPTPRVFQFTAAAGGTGRGYFTLGPSSAVPFVSARWGGLKLADLDGDGDLDILNATPFTETSQTHAPTSALLVQLNDGTGRFTTGGQYNLGIQFGAFSHMTIGDVDNDGDLDVAGFIEGYPQSRQTVVCYNNGRAQFSPARGLGVIGRYFGEQSLYDMDGDGDLDLLAPFASIGQVSVWYNDGSGATTNVAYAFPVSGEGTVAADIEGDGDLDMVMASGNSLSVALNSGGTTLRRGSDYSIGAPAWGLATADLNNDGHLDLLSANGGNWNYGSSSNTVSVRLNDGQGGFATGSEATVGSAPRYVATADIDADGDLDMLTANYVDKSISVRLNDGRGAMAGGYDIPLTHAPGHLSTGDVDGDGDIDFVTFVGGLMQVYLNQPAAAPLSAQSPGRTAALSVQAYPNPYQGQLRLQAQAAKAGLAQLALYDAKGSRLWEGTAPLRAGNNDLDLPQAGSLPTGLLMLTVRQGGHQQVVKIQHQ